jgi:hypothetical protein
MDLGDKMKKHIYLLTLLFFQNYTFASDHIAEIHSLKEIPLKNLKPGSVIFLDVDDNVLSTNHPDQFPIFGFAQSPKHYRLLEPDIAQTTYNMKTSIDGDPHQVIILGLTKRCMIHSDGRHDEADSQLEQENVYVSRHRFKHLDGITLCNNRYSGFRNGVIYTGGQEKSAYADHFFQLAGIAPSLIKFSDDVKENLYELIAYAEKNAIPIDAYHMTRVRLLSSFINGPQRDGQLPQKFDPDMYLRYNLDVQKVVADKTVSEQFSFAQHHYLTWGKNEQRFIGYPKDFSPNRYIDLNPDLKSYVMSHSLDPTAFAWSHYREFGHKEKRAF